MTETPYTRGYRAGIWTREQLNDAKQSAEDTLRLDEENHEDRMRELAAIFLYNPEAASAGALYLRGYIVASRESLTAIIKENAHESTD